MIELHNTDEIAEWCDRNFPNDDRACVILGLAEEVGELCRTQVKTEQGVRGTTEEWYNEALKELGDVFIKWVHVCTVFDVDPEEVVNDRWAIISQRDINHDPVTEPDAEETTEQDMICPPCAQAGGILQAARNELSNLGADDIDRVRTRVSTLHGECQGCECQHESDPTKQILNEERVAVS
jgi:NTP pyrophosphatase (non-canonical NTP hydrolase)